MALYDKVFAAEPLKDVSNIFQAKVLAPSDDVVQKLARLMTLTVDLNAPNKLSESNAGPKMIAIKEHFKCLLNWCFHMWRGSKITL